MLALLRRLCTSIQLVVLSFWASFQMASANLARAAIKLEEVVEITNEPREQVYDICNVCS